MTCVYGKERRARCIKVVSLAPDVPRIHCFVRSVSLLDTDVIWHRSFSLIPYRSLYMQSLHGIDRSCVQLLGRYWLARQTQLDTIWLRSFPLVSHQSLYKQSMHGVDRSCGQLLGRYCHL